MDASAAESALYLSLADAVCRGARTLEEGQAAAHERAMPGASAEIVAYLTAEARRIGRAEPRRAYILASLAHTVSGGSRDPHTQRRSALALAEAANRLGRWTEAEAVSSAALACEEGAEDALSGWFSLQRAAASFQLNRIPDAETHCTQARATFDRAGDSLGLAESALLQAAIARASGRYAEALDRLYQASSQFSGEVDQARCRVERGYIQACQGQYEPALENLRAAQEVLVQAGARSEIAWNDRVQAIVHLDREDYPAALEALAEAIAIYRHEDMPTARLFCERNQAHAYLRLGEADRALAIYFQVRDGFERLGMRIDMANTDMYLGLAYKEQTRYRQARVFLERAESACRDLGLELHAARCRANLAQVEEMLGEYDRALEGLQHSGEVFAAAGPELAVLEAHCAENMARIYLTTGESDQAARLLDQAGARFEAAGAPLLVASTHIALAQVRLAEGQPEQARELLEAARAAYRAAGVRGPVALCTLRLADVETSLGRWETAARWYAEARDEFIHLGWPVSVALSDLGRGEASLGQGDTESAARRFASALGALDPDLPDFAWRAYDGLSHCHFRAGQRLTALQEALQAIEAIRRGRSGLHTAQGSSTYFAARRRSVVYDQALDLALDLRAIAQALEIIEAGKAQANLSLLHNPFGALHPGTDPHPLNALLAEEQVSRQRVAALTRELSFPSPAEDGQTAPPTAGAGLKQQLDQARREHDRLIARLLRARPLWTSIAHPPRFDVDAFRQAAAAAGIGHWGSLSYYRSGSRLSSVYLDSERIQAWTHELTPFEEKVLRLSCWIDHKKRIATFAGPDRDGMQRQEEADERALRYAYSLLIPPEVEERLSPDGLLILAPHGSLHNLPFAALLAPDGQPFLAHTELAYSPSLHTLHLLLARRRSAGSPRAALLAGITEFGTRANRNRSAAHEIRAVASVWQAAGRSPVVWLDQQATRASLLEWSERGALRDYGVLHFATHAVFQKGMALESRLLLADGDLTAADVLLHLSLDAAVVVLSSCEGALGEENAGDEKLGLAIALFEAGAQAVLAGLWPVADSSAIVLMAKFHRALLAGQRPAQALRTAQMEMIAAGYTPYHWAPFVLLGHPGLGLESDREGTAASPQIPKRA